MVSSPKGYWSNSRVAPTKPMLSSTQTPNSGGVEIDEGERAGERGDRVSRPVLGTTQRVDELVGVLDPMLKLRDQPAILRAIGTIDGPTRGALVRDHGFAHRHSV